MTRKGTDAWLQATSLQLAACLTPDTDSHYRIRVAHANELDNGERNDLCVIFEANMRNLYTNSSFGWNPAEKHRELFNAKSRFLMTFSAENNLVAFCMFRFETEETDDVLYCYELQVSNATQRVGVGNTLVQRLWEIGLSYEMDKIMLTVLKGNTAALGFYKKQGFAIDESSPSMFLVEVDYEIMSKRIE
ncbi:hypothetical protein APHAL10511_006326 [Amanita phalloides]|nr:hypothetical protein APHAL10511_006326 [Amanita phalloides]